MVEWHFPVFFPPYLLWRVKIIHHQPFSVSRDLKKKFLHLLCKYSLYIIHKVLVTNKLINKILALCFTHPQRAASFHLPLNTIHTSKLISSVFHNKNRNAQLQKHDFIPKQFSFQLFPSYNSYFLWINNVNNRQLLLVYIFMTYLITKIS